MAMESLEVLNSKFESRCEDSVPVGDDVRESENLDVDLLADLESYWQDINDRLTISRMVSDSVIKGMVTAVTRDAAERIARKELEVFELKEMLHSQRISVDEKETFASLERQQESNGASGRTDCSFSEAVTEHDRMRETLVNLRSVSKEQFMKLKKEINRIRGCNSMKRISSGSELLGLGGILHEPTSERCSDADKTLDSLKTMIETLCTGVDEIVQSSEASLHEWKLEQVFQAEVEALVLGNCIRSLEQECEEKLWGRICGDKSVNWSGNMKEISSLREELNSLSKSLCVPEAGQLISHGSWDGDGWTNGKKSHFQHKVLGNHVALSPTPCEENGKHEEPQNNKLENPDPNCLNHLSRDELVAFYNNEMTKMKRNHESKVQEMTEEYFSLKREYLREKGSSLLLKKDKEFNMLRKKIPEVILKLDDLLENDKIPASNDAESLGSLKERLETLLAENRQLRDSLTDKKKEVKCLATQVSDATERMSQHSLSETKLLNMIRYLKSSIEDLHIEASIGADVFNCLLGEMTTQIKRTLDESCAEYNFMQQHYESIIKEASHNAQQTSKCGVEDSDMLSIIVQGVFEVIFRESWQEAKDKLDMLTRTCISEKEARVSLEKEASKKEKTLQIELADKERLKQEIFFLAQEKERLAHDAAAALQIERERLQLAAKELESLRNQHQILISESSKESEAMKGDLVVAQREIELYKMEMCKLNEKLELAVKDFAEADKERRKLLVVTQEKQNAMSLHEANERELRKQMDSMSVLVQGLSKAAADFECRVTQGISKNYSRLKNLSSQSCLLTQKANILRRTGVLYKQRLERRFSDLQKAEAEVDLLGDEVDTLLSLLEKIYIGLDHYSPILQHYPGIIEILKLVKRELSGESTRSVRSKYSPA